MCVGTCSGVTSAGIVISSALLGTSSAYSSLTRDSIREVLPTPRSPISSILTLRRGATGRCTMLPRVPPTVASTTPPQSLADGIPAPHLARRCRDKRSITYNRRVKRARNARHQARPTPFSRRHFIQRRRRRSTTRTAHSRLLYPSLTGISAARQVP